MRSLVARLARIGVAVAAMLAAIGYLATRPGQLDVPGEPSVPAAAAPEPIASEALVFRPPPGGIVLETGAAAARPAHRRTLASFRARRAYPGAPPRVPHGLTSQEFQRVQCNTCHERGGFSQRFQTYIPVTPHPEWSQCLQCHATDAALVGVPLPGSQPDANCRQCHAPAERRIVLPSTRFESADWPSLEPTTIAGAPPAIPHDLTLRGNCLACHMGPGAVTEIRTRHPERGNCRQCHVSADPAVSTFTRPIVARSGGGLR